jgi:hypothetical protein
VPRTRMEFDMPAGRVRRTGLRERGRRSPPSLPQRLDRTDRRLPPRRHAGLGRFHAALCPRTALWNPPHQARSIPRGAVRANRFVESTTPGSVDSTRRCARELELTRFRGHLLSRGEKGVHNGETAIVSIGIP